MTVVRGLKKINDFNNEREERRAKRAEEGDRPRNQWFKLQDGESAKVIFLQELDEDSPNFSSKNDLGVLAVEHNNPAPNMWMRKALCTIDEGDCWACEQHRKDWKAGWKQKTRLYINVLVDNGEDEPFVAILSQGQGPKSITPTLIEYATDDGTITDKWFTIKRNGKELSDTSYTLRAGKEHDKNVEDYEVVDLNTVLRHVPYAEQEAHYLDGGTVEAAEPAKVAVSASSVDAEW